MPLHPSTALDHIIEEHKDHLLSEFRAKDPRLLEALEREVSRDLFLAQEPFYQAHRPFRPGSKWAGLPIDSKLAAVMEERRSRGRCLAERGVEPRMTRMTRMARMGRGANVEHPTSNAEREAEGSPRFDVGRSAFDVRRSF
jgi:hypothetical protein